MLAFFIRMMKKQEQAGPRTPPLLANKDGSVSWGHSLVQETLDSIDEVWRCQDPKTELSCFYLRRPILCPLPKFSGAILPGPLFFLIFAYPDTTLPGPSSLLPSTLQIFHGLMEIGPLLLTLTVSFNPLT
jgi:hypothetical protein